jgi:hydroxymethylpyrimidine pyrophosphatase-like HAD family hydrolase
MDFKVTAVGSQSHVRTPTGFTQVAGWPHAPGWDRSAIQQALLGRPELRLQDPIAQADHKRSFDVYTKTDAGHDAYANGIVQQLAGLGIAAQVIASGRRFLDILPQGVHKGSGLLHTLGVIAPERPYIVAAGDSLNDTHLLEAADLAILPGNTQDSLRQWALRVLPRHKLYLARAPFAAGILEGLRRRKLVFA